MGGQFTAALIRLGGNLLLTRLLVPEAFGLMAIVYVMMTGFLLFSDVGLGPNIIQSKRGEDQAFLDTAWVIQIFRGALVWLAASILSAGLYVATQYHWLPQDSVYAHPLLPWVIVAYSASQFIGGFYPTRLLVAGRQFSLARVTQIEIAQQIIGLIIMVVWALLDRSIWALVGGTLLTAIIRLPLYHFFLPGQVNRWHWDVHAFKEILGFGKWVFLSSIMGFLVLSGDRLLLGGLVDANQLGIYSIAYLMVSAPQMIIGQLMGKVAFPALSEIVRKNPSQLRGTYYKFRLYFDSAILFTAGALFTFGSELINLLYDDRYHGAGPIMEILALGLIATRYQLADRCYLALGKPNLLTPINVVYLLSLYLLVPLAFSLYGFNGAVWAIALNPFFSWPMVFYFKIKHYIFDWKKELMVLPVFVLGAGAGMLLSYMAGPLKSVAAILHALVH
jgi:O-antigen/teichoic acid export membrane protein